MTSYITSVFLAMLEVEFGNTFRVFYFEKKKKKEEEEIINHFEFFFTVILGNLNPFFVKFQGFDSVSYE